VSAVNRRAVVLCCCALAVLVAVLALAPGEAGAAPFVLQGERFTGAEATSGAHFGRSVALSADGNTALVGAPEEGGGAGAAWVFTRSGGVWTQQGGELTGAGEVGSGLFGTSVDLSADGTTAVIGGPSDNGEIGAAWVFTRSGTTWTQQGAKLTASKEVGSGLFGASVALSGDGATAVIGAPDNKGGMGAAWVFERPNTTWKQRKKLTAKGHKELFGSSVSLTDDASTALVGSPGDEAGYGAAWAFKHEGKTWTHPGEKLVGSPGEVKGFGEVTGRGRSVTLSGDGSTALIGGFGAAWVFVTTGSAWAQQGPVIEDRQTVPFPPDFGATVALSLSGDEVLVGAPRAGEFKGEVRVFERSASSWTLSEGLVSGKCPTENPCDREFGAASALSADGETALVGGPIEATGFAWAFSSAP
jgi:hypothetical protein